MQIPGPETHEEPFHLLYEVKSKCHELTSRIDSILHLLKMMETYMTYQGLMGQLESATRETGPHSGESNSKGAASMNQQDMQKILSSLNSKDHSLSQDEFDTIFETLKQGKSQEEVARMEQMVQMAKNFLK